MAQLFALYALALLAIGVLDGIWLGLVAKDLYRREMGALVADSPRLLPAAIFYLAYPLAIVFFALLPLASAAESTGNIGTAFEAFLRCAALGLLAYGTYNLTNLSVIRGFSTSLALIDMAWGTFATAVAGAVAFGAVRWWVERS